MAVCKSCGQDYDESELAFIDVQNGIAFCKGCFKAISQRINTLAIDNTVAQGIPQNVMPIPQEILHGEIGGEEVVAEMTKTIVRNPPEKLKEFLDSYVISQEGAKKVLALAVYNHYKRTMYNALYSDRGCDDAPDELEKSNILMVGPSGTGKTYLVRSLAKKLNIPLAIVDASSLTEAGFVGSDPESCIRELYNAAGGDIWKTEHGIVFLDEFDKLARKSGDSAMITADPGREGVQQALLKILEGGNVNFTEQGQRKHPDAPTITVNTKDILFICGGAFDGIEKIIEQRVCGSAVGFSTGSGEDNIDLSGMDEFEQYNALIDRAKPEDFKKYGIITEVLGRLPIICKLHQLSEDEIVSIMVEPKNALVKQYKTLASIMSNVSLEFEKDALSAIAHQVIEQKIGARGLRSVIELHVGNAMYSAPTNQKDGMVTRILVTKECIEDNVEPKIDYITKTA